jgi:4-alpha-glucanotransferase
MDNEAPTTNDPLAAVRMNKSVFTIGTLDEDDTRAYWASRTVEERLEAMELMRMINYGYNPITDRLQRVLEVVEVGAG